jgi:hypothetical protein
MKKWSYSSAKHSKMQMELLKAFEGVHAYDILQGPIAEICS